MKDAVSARVCSAGVLFSVVLLFAVCFSACSKIPTSQDQVFPPEFSKPEGIYGHDLSITLRTSTPGAAIHYTTDGTQPGPASAEYSDQSPIPVAIQGTQSVTVVIKAIAVKGGLSDSDVVTCTYVRVRAGIEDEKWYKEYDNAVGVGLVTLPSGAVCSVGYVNSASTGRDAVIRMFTTDGKDWTRVFDVAGTNDTAIAADYDPAGYLYMSGTSVNAVSSASGMDWVVRKLDLSGNLIWQKMFDGGSGNDYMNAVKVDSKKNVYIAGSGYCLAGEHTIDDWWVKKLDPDGNEISGWNKSFDGRSDEDYINKIAIDSKDSVYIVGCSKNLVSEVSGFDWWAKKFSEDGTFLWELKCDGSGSDDYINYVSVDSSDNVYFVGNGENLRGPATRADWWIKKFSADGKQLWEQTYDGNGGNDYLNSSAVDAEDNLYVVGAGYIVINEISNYDWWIERLSGSDGKMDSVYTKTISYDNKSRYANTIVLDSDNNIIVIGYGEGADGLEVNRNWWLKKFFN